MTGQLAEPEAQISDVATTMEIFRLFEAGDREAIAGFAHPEIAVGDIGSGSTFHGFAGVRMMLAEWPDPSRTWRSVDLSFSETTDGVVVTGSLESENPFGAPIRLPVSWLFSFKDGKVVGVRWHRLPHPPACSEAD